MRRVLAGSMGLVRQAVPKEQLNEVAPIEMIDGLQEMEFYEGRGRRRAKLSTTAASVGLTVSDSKCWQEQPESLRLLMPFPADFTTWNRNTLPLQSQSPLLPLPLTSINSQTFIICLLSLHSLLSLLNLLLIKPLETPLPTSIST